MEKKSPFRVGDRVICLRANSKVLGCKGRLKAGETYTVTDVHTDGWLCGINLAEAPIVGAAYYSASRFAPA